MSEEEIKTRYEFLDERIGNNYEDIKYIYKLITKLENRLDYLDQIIERIKECLTY